MRTPPVSGAWQPGDDPGRRQFVRIAVDRPFILDGGGRLRDVDIAYETWGTLAPDGANAVLVCHAWTGDSHAAGHRRSSAAGRRGGGKASSAPVSPSTPTGTSSCAPTSSAAARARPARRRPIRTTAGPTGRASPS